MKSLSTCTRRAPLTCGVARGCDLHIPARPTCSRAALGPLLVLVEALTSSNAGLALVNLLFEQGNNATLYGLWILSCRVHQSNVVCGDQANDVEMFKAAYYSFAVKNAAPVAKEVARFMADSNENLGVLKILNYLL